MKLRLICKTCLCVFFAILLLAACGRQQTISESEISANEVEPVYAEDSLPQSNNTNSNNIDSSNIDGTDLSHEYCTHGFTFTYNGQPIYMGMPREELENEDNADFLIDTDNKEEGYIGELVFVGFNTLLFDDPQSGKEVIGDLIFTSENVFTDEGLHIGSTLEEVNKKYFDPVIIQYVGDVFSYNYYNENSHLSLKIEDGNVTEIHYSYTIPFSNTQLDNDFGSITFDGKKIFLGMQVEALERISGYNGFESGSIIPEYHLLRYKYDKFDVVVSYGDENHAGLPGIVYELMIQNDKITTDEGLRIGDTYQTMEKIYGKPKIIEDRYVYENNNCQLSVTISENEVSSIILRYLDPSYQLR